MTKSTLNNIIEELKIINIVVVAIVSDMRPKNASLWNEIGISNVKPYFSTISVEKIFVFADIPHLIKLLRNHFLDNGFVLNNKIINSNSVQELFRLEKEDLKLCHKVTEQHLTVKGAARQKVKFATQLFSHSVAQSIKWCVTHGKINSPNALECSDFIKSVND